MVVAGAGEDSGELVLTGYGGSFEKNGKVLQMMVVTAPQQYECI